MPTFVNMMKSVLDDAKIPYRDDFIKIITPLGYSGTADYFISLGLGGTKEEIMAEMNRRAIKEYTCNIDTKATVKETLKELKARGAGLNILTASPHAMLDPCLKRNGIFDLFDNVWSCDDFGTAKSDPEIYRAAARIGVSIEDIIFLDDNPNAAKTAKSAGATVIGVYDESSAEYESEMRKICSGYICKFAELV